jgi:hypothetical protein
VPERALCGKAGGAPSIEDKTASYEGLYNSTVWTLCQVRQIRDSMPNQTSDKHIQPGGLRQVAPVTTGAALPNMERHKTSAIFTFIRVAVVPAYMNA